MIFVLTLTLLGHKVFPGVNQFRFDTLHDCTLAQGLIVGGMPTGSEGTCYRVRPAACDKESCWLGWNNKAVSQSIR